MIALYDACVLYPAPLRDLLMHLALTGLYQAKWTTSIQAEWTRNVLKARPDLTMRQLQRTRDLMDSNVAECLVEAFEHLIPALELPDPNDRHVLAAAIHCHADVVVTFNLADFPGRTLSPFGIKAQNPDDFVVRLLRVTPEPVCAAIRRQRQSLHKPKRTATELLLTIHNQGLVQTAEQLRDFLDEL